MKHKITLTLVSILHLLLSSCVQKNTIPTTNTSNLQLDLNSQQTEEKPLGLLLLRYSSQPDISDVEGIPEGTLVRDLKD